MKHSLAISVLDAFRRVLPAERIQAGDIAIGRNAVFVVPPVMVGMLREDVKIAEAHGLTIVRSK